MSEDTPDVIPLEPEVTPEAVPEPVAAAPADMPAPTIPTAWASTLLALPQGPDVPDTLTKDQVMLYFAGSVIANLSPSTASDVKNLDINSIIELIMTIAQEFMTFCGIASLGSVLTKVAARPNGIRAIMARLQITAKLIGHRNDLGNTEHAGTMINLADTILSHAVSVHQNPDMWHAVSSQS